MSCQNYKCQKNYNNYNNYNEYNGYKCINSCGCTEGMTHVHEYESSVKLAEEGCDRHNHRAAGVTGEVIPINNGTNHVHKINDRIDFLDHFHRICVTTGPAIMIPGTKKHVHLVCGNTTFVDEHCHQFLFTTQINAPLV
ncbi:hypothetical protein HF520_04040 [Romboutsia sp. CE17]|uniref:YmaF family protein n=1 Tax=Romboutsia sp. CE17 TaxID=2724150 RepID=UPI001442A772|nr:YmaF family protein [Romboutsia sp. CE17]QJA08167.1 hypothetical protein HF520_04040 [Romboutsia sp. CE17]